MVSTLERDADIKTQYSGVRGWIERMLNMIGNMVLGGDFVFRQTTDGTPIRVKVGKDFPRTQKDSRKVPHPPQGSKAEDAHGTDTL